MAIEKNKKRIFRCRPITSCQRCFEAKRKCDKIKPSCTRCSRLETQCIYFTLNQVHQRKNLKVGQSMKNELDEIGFVNLDSDNNAISNDNNNSNNNSNNNTQININTPTAVINPQPRLEENTNFKLIVNSTGEYSKYFPTCLFPFYEHSSNVSWVVDTKRNRDEATRSGCVFDFNTMCRPMSGIDEIKSFIPNEEMLNVLVDHFFSSVFPVIPIIDKEEFYLKFKLFCQNQKEFDDVNFLMILFAILFSSCTSIILMEKFKNNENMNGNNSHTKNNNNNNNTNTNNSINYSKLRITFYECIENLKYLMSVYVTPSLSALTSLSIIYYMGSLNGYTITIQVSTLSKLSQIFGLHRTIVDSQQNDTPIRKLVYCFIWYLDVLNSYYTGLPCNMHQDYFESQSLFPYSTDINILAFFGKLSNAKVWSIILSNINKTKISTIEDYRKIEQIYNETILTVDKINEQILNSKDQASLDYLKWLVVENRMGLTKSAMLIDVFRHQMNYIPEDKMINQITTELVLQSLVLINETILKFLIGSRISNSTIWYNRLCFPFQAMYVVLSHIKQYPHFQINFSHINGRFKFTFDESLGVDLFNGDIRMAMVEKSISILQNIKNLWYPTTIDRFGRVIQFKKYVDSFLLQSMPTSTQNFQLDALPNQLEPSAYTFLDDSMLFMMGEEFQFEELADNTPFVFR